MGLPIKIQQKCELDPRLKSRFNYIIEISTNIITSQEARQIIKKTYNWKSHGQNSKFFVQTLINCPLKAVRTSVSMYVS